MRVLSRSVVFSTLFVPADSSGEKVDVLSDAHALHKLGEHVLLKVSDLFHYGVLNGKLDVLCRRTPGRSGNTFHAVPPPAFLLPDYITPERPGKKEV